jgi:HPt (histidine-containing phosphotransfer) domain-containing protein
MASVTIDWTALEARNSGRESFLHEISNLFLESTMQSLEEARIALESHDVETAWHVAHQLKGAASYMQAPTIKDRADIMANAARAANWEGYSAMIESLSFLTERLESTIAQRFGGKNENIRINH